MAKNCPKNGGSFSIQKLFTEYLFVFFGGIFWRFQIISKLWRAGMGSEVNPCSEKLKKISESVGFGFPESTAGGRDNNARL